MNIRSLIEDDDAVSPVIGVILMVAITVILAAVIASFVLGLGEDAATQTPTASFNTDYSDNGDDDPSNSDAEIDEVVITQQSGDTISGDQLSLGISGASATDDNGGSNDDESSNVNGNHDWVSGVGGDSEVTAGSSVTLDSTTSAFPASALGDEDGDVLDFSGATIRINWEASSGETSATLNTWEGPDA